ncbi:C2H2 finger domain-containingprotein [Purpureocillium lavendulum]|uniref:C2H2 finger domain-containingprotein n=1 Tax=Purpureocillium lavendulum TaxID=1247861 RepID=A0AB34FXN6_9HYPO|nr:C2H2 finger domain-containingprotein [Purpureocillium lavendulum]
MAFSLGGLSKRSVIVLVVIVLAVLTITQHLNYTDDFTLDGQLSNSINILDACTLSTSNTGAGASSHEEWAIPNTIHQVWKSNDVSTYSPILHASRDAWKAMFEPLNYTVKLWTDEDISQLVKTKYPWLKSTYDGYPQNIQRADIARLLVVHAEGGLYADLDVYPKSSSHIQCLQQVGLQAIFAPTGGTAGLSNHFFMASRGSGFLQWALYEAKRRGGPSSRRIFLPYLQVFWSTGPLMLTAAFRKYAWLYGTLRYDLGLLEEAYARATLQHAAGRSWHGSDGHALNYIADHVRVDLLLMGTDAWCKSASNGKQDEYKAEYNACIEDRDGHHKFWQQPNGKESRCKSGPESKREDWEQYVGTKVWCDQSFNKEGPSLHSIKCFNDALNPDEDTPDNVDLGENRVDSSHNA